MPAPTAHLLITLRGPVWRVRILSGGTIRWKCYRAEDYPRRKPWPAVRGGVSHDPSQKITPMRAKKATFAAISGQSMIHLFGFGGSAGGGCKVFRFMQIRIDALCD